MRLLVSYSILVPVVAFAPSQRALYSKGRPALQSYQKPPRSVLVFDQMGISEADYKDGAKEILQNTPADEDSPLVVDFVEEIQLVAPVAESVGEAIFLANSGDNAQLIEALVQENVLQPETQVTDGLPTLKIGQVTTDSDVSDMPSADEAVDAILAASEEAVAIAEASLSQDPTAMSGEEDTSSPVTDESSISAPNVSKILKFAVPAVGVWLCSPLLSLIDTSAVGLLSGTVHQAALNPAVAVTDYAALLIAFMYTGTTNLIAASMVKDKGVEGSPKTTKTLVGVLQLSTFVGAGLGAILFVFARTLLRTIIGNDGISPAVFDAAMKYVRIRAIGMPAAAMIGSAQAACLGMQDIRSPLYVLLGAAVVNLLGDMLFVGCQHPWIGGAAGAAWATVFSQYFAVGIFIRWMTHKRRSKAVTTEPSADDNAKTMDLSNAILELMDSPTKANRTRRMRFVDAVKSFKSKLDDTKNDSAEPETERVPFFRRLRSQKVAVKKQSEESFSVRGFLKGKLKKRDLVKFPPRATIDEFTPYVVPVTSTQVGRVSGYIAMSHVVSSSLGTISMAAQQIIVSLFYCLTPIADSLSLTAQSFLPSISEKKPSAKRSQALRNTLVNFLKAGGVFGTVMVAAVCSIPLLSGFFTSDPIVIGMVNSVTPLLVGIFAVHGFLCACEGLLLGQKDLGFLGKMYAGFFAVVPYFMLRVKRAALAGVTDINLTSVWKVFLGYQLFRWASWGARVIQIQKRTEREAPITTP